MVVLAPVQAPRPGSALGIIIPRTQDTPNLNEGNLTCPFLFRVFQVTLCRFVMSASFNISTCRYFTLSCRIIHVLGGFPIWITWFMLILRIKLLYLCWCNGCECSCNIFGDILFWLLVLDTNLFRIYIQLVRIYFEPVSCYRFVEDKDWASRCLDSFGLSHLHPDKSYKTDVFIHTRVTSQTRRSHEASNKSDIWWGHEAYVGKLPRRPSMGLLLVRRYSQTRYIAEISEVRNIPVQF